MIDLHTHILPGIDDGAESLEESVRLVEFLVSSGFEYIFATPHYKEGYFKSSVSEVQAATERLNAAVKAHGINCRILPGHEVSMDSVFTVEGELRDFCLIGKEKKYILLELPFGFFPVDTFFNIINELFSRKTGVILVHPERSEELLSNKKLYHKLYEQGIKFQVNLMSLTGFYGKYPMKMARKLLKGKMVFGLGSDAHFMEQITDMPGALKKAIKLMGKDEFDRMMREIKQMLQFPGS